MRVRFRRFHLGVASALAVLPVVSACATIIRGRHQDVIVSSSPASALVSVDGKDAGATPVTVSMRRKTNHLVRIALAGYAPFEVELKPEQSYSFVFGNVLIPLVGVIGLIVDTNNGAIMKLTPEKVSASLSRVASPLDGDILHVVVGMRVDPSLEKIGQLVRVP